ncbi:polysaccharide pyruvyl transferase family protein [uncultured Cyclobacterium sp.]|uniref:polysaccharide pyruvyl transferase family protein n=1 Tax=uncultured Cyclobacterium sp. TaxID=453820 RepID=UPI0030ED3EE2|tara:strand:- start:8019 stop:9104 length:1086 start_codon:yes stop_codon:yes gene_type:complete
MKKIKILTFVNENNYGALLQSFALQEACKSIGFTASFIDYKFRRPNGGTLSKVLFWIKNPFIILQKFKILPTPEPVDFSSFVDFRNRYLSIEGESYSNFNKLSSHPPNADVYITGSDQVWSPRIVSKEDLKSFFLCFGDQKVKRVSYAASFGGESLSEEYINFISNVSLGFDFCSIREKDNNGILKKIGVDDYKLVPDPTLLVEWSKVQDLSISKHKNIEIGLFILNPKHREIFFSTVNALYSESNPFEVNLDSKGNSVNPFVWIENISKCQFFVTDSYHAVIFCILTRTKFAVLLHDGEGSARNLRIIELLSRFGLEDRSSKDFNSKDLTQLMKNEIDWIDVEKRLIDYRKIGLEFLKSI